MGKENTDYGIYIAKSKLLYFRADTNLYQVVCKYLRDFIKKLEERFKQEDNATLKINDILQYLKRTPKSA